MLDLANDFRNNCCLIDISRQHAGGISYNRTLNPDLPGETGQTEGTLSINGAETSGGTYNKGSIQHSLYRNYHNTTQYKTVCRCEQTVN